MTTSPPKYADAEYAKELYGEDYVITSIMRKTKPDWEAFDRNLIAATSLMDSIIGTRYPVPMLNPAIIVRNYCVDIAIYRSSATPAQRTDEKRARYEDAVKWCKDVRDNGVAMLEPQADGTSDQDTGDSDIPQVISAPRLFSRRTLRGLV